MAKAEPKMSFYLNLKQILSRALDLFLPPLCSLCSEPVSTHQALCSSCWKKINFISAPLCGKCGKPLDVPLEENMVCAECLTHAPSFFRARSAIVYDDNSKRLVLSFKHGDRLHYVPAMAAWMHRAGSSFWDDADMLIPVPLHRWRLFVRRYNQSALLAREIARISGLECGVEALRRVRFTASQGTMDREQRRKNLSGAVRLNPRFSDRLKDKKIVLVDDVLTTGATVNECVRILLQAGAVRVDVLTLMRTRGFQ